MGKISVFRSPTYEEWLAAISFLTRTGQMCTDWRQEYILLSDTLGVTMLVDAINHPGGNGVKLATKFFWQVEWDFILAPAKTDKP